MYANGLPPAWLNGLFFKSEALVVVVKLLSPNGTAGVTFVSPSFSVVLASNGPPPLIVALFVSVATLVAGGAAWGWT